jgi:hypothetical protein
MKTSFGHFGTVIGHGRMVQWHYAMRCLKLSALEGARVWRSMSFPFTHAEELANHAKEYKLFEAAQNLRTDLCDLLNAASDGWVLPESWRETQLAHRELFDGMLQAVVSNPDVDDNEPVKDEMTLRAIWPFDLD